MIKKIRRKEEPLFAVKSTYHAQFTDNYQTTAADPGDWLVFDSSGYVAIYEEDQLWN